MKEIYKMLSGLLYQASDETLSKMRDKAKNLMYEYNQLRPSEHKQKESLLSELLGSIGHDVYMNQPIYVDYGKHIFIGDHFFSNYDCTFLDVAKITIGNNVMFGPKVSLLTATHPLDKTVRNEQYEYGLPITIKDDVWIGGNVVVNPGVTIGSGVVVGSGSVVTKDLPDDTLCYGNPCRVIRKLTDDDKAYWENQKTLSLSQK
jgi:maltose O-acetyltransferase